MLCRQLRAAANMGGGIKGCGMSAGRIFVSTLFELKENGGKFFEEN